jgi:hypothetical protein
LLPRGTCPLFNSLNTRSTGRAAGSQARRNGRKTRACFINHSASLGRLRTPAASLLVVGIRRVFLLLAPCVRASSLGQGSVRIYETGSSLPCSHACQLSTVSPRQCCAKTEIQRSFWADFRQTAFASWRPVDLEQLGRASLARSKGVTARGQTLDLLGIKGLVHRLCRWPRRPEKDQGTASEVAQPMLRSPPTTGRSLPHHGPPRDIGGSSPLPQGDDLYCPRELLHLPTGATAPPS